MMSVDGLHLRRLIEPPEWKVAGPVLSSDGHKILFTSISLPRANTAPTQGERFYAIAADGSHLTRLTDPPGSAECPAFIR